LILDILDM